ncbi:unnamed protein product [marine sediment metagenome]|uniref:ATP synthase archaeal subunit H n=1 Tax=marine sediment metagenome TaxID=412755 RepID=X0SNX0_9ZZZZ
MSTEQITSSIENIENEAEKTLEQARSRAGDIILKAKEEASRVISSEVPLDDVKGECEQILKEARKKADKDIEASKKKASEMRAGVSKKVGKITERIVNIITGAKQV